MGDRRAPGPEAPSLDLGARKLNRLSTGSGDVFEENVTFPSTLEDLHHGRMQLPVHLRAGLQRAYEADFGRILNERDAEALGTALLDLLGNALARKATIHRSAASGVDDSMHKREPTPTLPNL